MKKLFAVLLFIPSAAFADIKQEFVTSAQITVDMPYVVTNKVGTTYSLSGNNITPSVTVGDTTTSGKIGGINVGSLTNGVPAMIQTDTSVTSAGSAFSKTESVIMGDATPSTVTPSSGIAALPVLGGQTTIGSGGTAGSLALTSLSSGIHTCTAGGSGTSCIGSTKVNITIDLMILPIVSALLAILIYGTCSFALYKVLLDRGNTYMDRLRKSRARSSSVQNREFYDI